MIPDFVNRWIWGSSAKDSRQRAQVQAISQRDSAFRPGWTKYAATSITGAKQYQRQNSFLGLIWRIVRKQNKKERISRNRYTQSPVESDGRQPQFVGCFTSYLRMDISRQARDCAQQMKVSRLKPEVSLVMRIVQQTSPKPKHWNRHASVRMKLNCLSLARTKRRRVTIRKQIQSVQLILPFIFKLMEENQNLEENTYSQEEVERIAQEAVESVLKEVVYEEPKVQGWINQICEKITEQLINLGKPYKYIVHCTIMQRNGAGAFVTTSQWWDTVADGQVLFAWPKDKQAKQEQQKNTLHCIVGVFAVSMI